MSDLRLVYPVDPGAVVTQTFAEHVHAAMVNGWSNYNGGIDWGVNFVPFAAAADGLARVRNQGNTGYGLHVIIKHDDGHKTIYAHLSSVYIVDGQRVRAGELIGVTGNSGNSTGPHLHFELRNPQGKPIDPALYLVAVEPTEQPETTPALLEIGQTVYIQPNWNLRAGPGASTADLGTADRAMPAEIVSLDGDWVQVRVAVWVHRDGVEG